MTTTNREGLIVFSENIERLNTVLAELQVSLSKQEELVKLNRQTTTQISELKKVMSEGSASIVAKLQSHGDELGESTVALGEALKASMASQNKALASGHRVNLSSLESAIIKSLGEIDKKIASNKVLMGVAASQKRTKAEIEGLKAQSKEIKKLLEIQQNRITFP